MSNATTITILVENVPGPNLAAEHGLSFWIQSGGLNILFDTGQGAALSPNARHLGIDLAAADHIVLSHGHYDHAGALDTVLERNNRATVHMHPAARRERFSIHDGTARSIGVPAAPAAALDRLASARLAPVVTPTLIAPGIGLTGAIPRNTQYEDTGGPFFLDSDGHAPDPIEDDLALWIATAHGLVVVVGCAHSGIVNTVRYALEISGSTILRAVLGGFHLAAADDARLDATIEAFRALSPGLIVPCHCTGERAARSLARAFPGSVEPGPTGSVFRFDDGPDSRQKVSQ